MFIETTLSVLTELQAGKASLHQHLLPLATAQYTCKHGPHFWWESCTAQTLAKFFVLASGLMKIWRRLPPCVQPGAVRLIGLHYYQYHPEAWEHKVIWLLTLVPNRVTTMRPLLGLLEKLQEFWFAQVWDSYFGPLWRQGHRQLFFMYLIRIRTALLQWFLSVKCLWLCESDLRQSTHTEEGKKVLKTAEQLNDKRTDQDMKEGEDRRFLENLNYKKWRVLKWLPGSTLFHMDVLSLVTPTKVSLVKGPQLG